ncbi:peptidase, partial [bacterium]|nr:peptidase [bacterium]
FKNKESVEFIRKIYTTCCSEDSPAFWQKLLLTPLNNPVMLSRYNITKDYEPLNKNDLKNEKYKNIANENCIVKDIIENKIAYIKIKQMLGKPLRDLDEQKIGSYLKKIKNYSALIIDIRGNGGGDSKYWSDFLVPNIITEDITYSTFNFYKKGKVYSEISNFLIKNPSSNEPQFKEIKDLNLQNFPNLSQEIKESFLYYQEEINILKPSTNSIKFKGNIYLIVDEKVYSSSEMFAVFAKINKWAIIIGKVTGGDGIGSDPWFDVLPNSGFLIQFSKSIGTDSSGLSNEEFKTIPDYIINKPINENLLKDEMILKVIELEKN